MVGERSGSAQDTSEVRVLALPAVLGLADRCPVGHVPPGGTGTLQGLLDKYKVSVVFNGKAHIYERNKPDSAGLVSYLQGNGGSALGGVSGCQPFDLFALGSKGSHCGAAPVGQTDDHVYGFSKVTVSGRQVTVAPTDELGRTYDMQTYNFPAPEVTLLAR